MEASFRTSRFYAFSGWDLDMNSLYNEIRKKIICETRRKVKEIRQTPRMRHKSPREQARQLLEDVKISLNILREMNNTQLQEMNDNYDYLEESTNIHTYWHYYISVTGAISSIVRFHDLGLNSNHYREKKRAYLDLLSSVSKADGREKSIESRFPTNRDYTYLELSIQLEGCGFNEQSIRYVVDFIKYNYDKKDNGEKYKDRGNRKWNKSSWESIVKKHQH